MTSRIILAALTVASFAAVASAQDQRFELSGTAGWTFSDGVTGSAEDLAGNEFARIDPADAFSWGLRAGYMVNDNLEIGALFDAQATEMVVSLRLGGATVQDFTLGDETVYNYHGYFAYNFGESASLKPYVLLGLGATQYSGITINPAELPVPTNRPQREIGSNTKFSATWGAGVKIFPGNNFGIRLEGRWTPTYIKSDAEGWWCDPYWGCYTVGDAQYSNQFELGGGIVLRF